MRVYIQGSKYAICSDGKGKMWLERGGEIWDDDPTHSKVLSSVAYELAVLRRIVKAVDQLIQHTNKEDSELLPDEMKELAELMNSLGDFCDFRQNLNDKDEI